MDQNNQHPLLSLLNSAQQDGAREPEGAHIIIAGAGSGKTRVITTRIAYLMSHYQIPAHRIIALTFTNKAGNEMKERLTQFLPDTRLPFVGTFHSYCVQLLRTYRKYLPFEQFTIIDTDDQQTLLRKIIKRHNIEKLVTPQKAQGIISFAKNHLPTSITTGVMDDHAPYIKELFKSYEAEKKQSHLFDFDDLMLKVLELLTQHPEVQQELQTKIQHVLVDEYQDTNEVQHALLKKICLRDDRSLAVTSICIVGDEDQSIYSWRGAKADNMQRFANDFAPVKITKIEQNYRSVQPILEAANAVIANNPNRTDKKLWSERKATKRILQLHCQSGYQEADIACHIVQLRKKKIPLSQIALLYRAHHQSRVLEEALMHSNVPYKIIGGIRFYERKEIKDLLAYLRISVNLFDRASLFRIINTPARGLGEKFEKALDTLWQEHLEDTVLEVLSRAKASDDIRTTQKQIAAIDEITTIITKLATISSPSLALEYVLQATKYLEYLDNEYEPLEAEGKRDNVKELLTSLKQFELSQDDATLAGFLEEVTLMQEHTSDEETEKEMVNLMTLHTAKGLEFDTIILPGLEEEVLPSSRSIYEARALEEERRLFYVGITRAKEYLIITHSELRNSYGTVNRQMPSRFLQELPRDLVSFSDIRQEHPLAQKELVSSWFGENYVGPRMFVPHTQTRPNTPPSIKPRSTYPPQSTSGSAWKKFTPVIHPTFGTGIVLDAAQKASDEWFLTIKFKQGVKKISSKFIQRA